MYDILLLLHSYLRWAVVVLAVWAIVKGLLGTLNKTEFTDADRKTGLFFMISCDVQLLLGLILYAGVSPLMQTAFADFGAAMKDSSLRYFAVEHIFVMIIALALVHVGYAKTKRAVGTIAANRTALIFYGIAFLLMMSRIPWTDRPLFR
ncbi:MAG: hypothetical protein U0Y10_27325 [Spirosomataceae bacterium]